MKDQVLLSLEQVVILAGSLNAEHPKLVKLLATHAALAGGKGKVTITTSRTDAKKMQTAILHYAQTGKVSTATYTAINDAFRAAYDETLRRKCGEA